MTSPSLKAPWALTSLLGLSLALAAADRVQAFPKPKYAVDPESSRPAAAAAASSPSSAPVAAAGAVSDTPLPPASSRPPARPTAVIRPPVATTPLASSPSTIAPATGWSIYVVQPHDTLTGVSRRFGSSVRTLGELNELEPKAALRPGVRLKLPPGTVDRGKDPYAAGPAPATLSAASVAAPHRLAAKPAASKSAASKPVVAKPSVVAAEAPLKLGVAPGQAVAPPRPNAVKPAVGESAEHTAPSGMSVATAPPLQGPGSPRPYKPSPPTDAPPSTVTVGPSADAGLSGRGRFIWPVKGEVVSRFGPLGPGQRNDGVNIATEAGASVKAAAAGEVVYAGSSLPGFGNLVLLKHADGWVTAYAHLDHITVRMRDHVDQGQAIGAVGQSGGVDRPQLHFEARFAAEAHEKARPVDPLVLLPR